MKKLWRKIEANTGFHLLFLFFITITLRLYRFRTGEVITSSDEIYLYEYSLKPLYGIFSQDIGILGTELFRFFNFAWGWGTLLFSTLFAFVLTLFKIPLTETTMNLPYVFVGSGSVLLVYLLGKELINKWYGLFIGLFFAFMPSHIAFSRTIGVNGVVGLFFFLTILLLFLKYCKTNKKSFLIWTYVFFGFYFVSDNQSLGILPLLFFMRFIFSKKENYLQKTGDAFESMFSWKGIFCFLIILMPTFLGAAYLTTQGLLQNSYLNIFHSKPIEISFYGQELFTSIIDNVGLFFTVFLILGFLLSVFFLFTRYATKEVIISFGWFLLYTIPWLFFVVPTRVNLRVYNTYTITSLLFIACFGFLTLQNVLTSPRSSFFRRIGVSSIFCFFLAVAVGTLFVAAKGIYDFHELPVSAPEQVFGSVGENNGIKTIGYYVRENTESDAVLFVDVESFVGEYYFNRKIVGALDLSPQQTAVLFEKTDMTKISYVYLQNDNKPLFEPLLISRGFYPLVFAEKDDAVVGVLYTKTDNKKSETEKRQPILLDIQQYDALFDQKYGTVHEIYVDYG